MSHRIKETTGGTEVLLSPEQLERKRTLLLAKATAAVLDIAGTKPNEFNNQRSRPIYEERRVGLLRRATRVEVGRELYSETVSRGWQLTEHLIQNGQYDSTRTKLVLEADGTLAIVNNRSSFLGGGGLSRVGSIGYSPSAVDYPTHEVSMDGMSSWRTLVTESFVQSKLADLVVSRGLHQDKANILAQVFENIPTTPTSPE